MIKYAVLALSLFLNAIFANALYVPDRNSRPKMTCEESRNETLNKLVTRNFAIEREGSFDDTHMFLLASDYEMRNVSQSSGMLTFVYVANHYRNTCGFHLPGIDTSIVRVRVDPVQGLRVIDVS
jgi:hypothetical protein